MHPLDSEAFNIIDLMLEDFSRRVRDGENPSVESYVRQNPLLEREIREALSIAGQLESVQLKEDRLRNRAASTSDPFPNLSKYRFVREIGRGGMGIVYEAEHVDLPRRVALKVLASHLNQSPIAKKRFQREARAASKLQHPNIISIHEVAEEHGILYFTMPLIQGMALDQVIARLRQREDSGFTRDFFVDAPINQSDSPSPSPTPLPSLTSSKKLIENHGDVPLSVTITTLIEGRDSSSRGVTSQSYFRSVGKLGQQIASAIAYAHAQGVLHRDIKPANLLLDAKGTVWVSDFGLAKDLNEESTMTGDLVGTIRYMAPERFSGTCDGRSDIYGIGLVLYELCTLRPVFEQVNRLQMLDTIRTRALPEPKLLVASIPMDLNTIISKAIEHDPKQRYGSASALEEDLHRFLNHQPIMARKIPAIRRMAMWCQRNPMASSLLATISLSLLSITLLSWQSNANLRIESQAAESARDEAIAARSLSEASAWESKLIAIRAVRTSRRPGQRYEALRLAKELNALPVPNGHASTELRQEVFGALCNADFSERESWLELPDDHYVNAVSDDFQLLAMSDLSGNVSILEASSKRVLHKLPGRGDVSTYEGAKFSADNQHILVHFADLREVNLWRIQGTVPVLRKTFSNVLDHAFSPDAVSLAILDYDHQLSLFDLASLNAGDGIPLPETGPMGWNPSLSQIAVGRQIVDLSNHAIAVQDVGKFGRVKELEWHPDGKQIAYIIDEDKLIFWDTLRNCEIEYLNRLRSKGGLMAAYNRSGSKLITTEWANVYSVYDAHLGDLLLRTSGGQSVLTFSKDDKRFGVDVSPNKMRLFDFAAGDEMQIIDYRTLASDGSQLFNSGRSTISADGRWMIMKVLFGSVIFDLERSEFVPSIELPGTPLGFEPSGELLMHYTYGIMRWTFRWDEQGNQLKVALAEEALFFPSVTPWARSSNGKYIGIPRLSESTLIGHFEGDQFQFDFDLGPQSDVRHCSFTPDGRFVALGSHGIQKPELPSLRVWDLETGQCVLEQRRAPTAWPEFSLDGRWLFVKDKSQRVLRVGTWEEQPHPNAQLTEVRSSPDGRFLICGGGDGIIDLVESKDLNLIAKLAVPLSEVISPLYLSEQAEQLVFRTLSGQRFGSINIRSIHDQLMELNPSWQFLENQKTSQRVIPPAAQVSFDPKELGLDWRPRWQKATYNAQQAVSYRGQGDNVQALECFEQAIILDPTNLDYANDFARFLLFGPEKMRDANRALELMRGCVKRAPNEFSYAITFAIALSRFNQFNESIETLDRLKSMRGYKSNGYEDYCRAYSLLQLERTEEAEICLARAKAWNEQSVSKLDSIERSELEIMQELLTKVKAK